MEPAELDALIARLEAPLPPNVLDDMFQDVLSSRFTHTGNVISHWGWVLDRPYEGKTYLLIEDASEQLHAIDLHDRRDIPFWAQLLGLAQDEAVDDAADRTYNVVGELRDATDDDSEEGEEEEEE